MKKQRPHERAFFAFQDGAKKRVRLYGFVWADHFFRSARVTDLTGIAHPRRYSGDGYHQRLLNAGIRLAAFCFLLA